MISTPLFYYGLCLLLGIAAQILFHPAYLAILTLLAFLMKERLISGMVVVLAGYLLAAAAVTLPTLPEEGIEGCGTFTPESVSYGHSPFGASLITRGSLHFTTATTTYRRVPCQIYTPLHKERPSASTTLKVEGRLIPKTFPNFVLKPTKIETGSSIFSLAELRFQIKDKVRHRFLQIFSSQTASSFLLSMVTGDIDDRLMSLQFNRIGLLHLLGISGFQFSLLAALLGTLLRVILPGARGAIVLIALLSAYALILGNSPPIQRAWVGTILYTIARLKGFQISPLNALGAALVWELLLDPCVFLHLGFQFSFLCTAAIFIVYPPLRDFFKRWLPGRTFQAIRELPLYERIGHTIAFLCRDTLALNLAIHLASLPLILFHFHKFPLLSLVYNLFLPQIVSIAYFFLIPALILEPLAHFAAAPLLKVAEWITTAVLGIADSPPALYDFQWRVPHVTLGWAVLLTGAVMCLFYEGGRLIDRARGR